MVNEMRKYTLDEIKETAWGHGWAFGKYTQQVVLDDDLKAFLDNSKQAIVAYMSEYNLGFKAGLAESFRTDNFDD